MKPLRINQKHAYLAILALVFATAGCRQQPAGEIPVNTDKVRDHIISEETARGYTAAFRAVTDSFYKKVPDLQKALNLAQAESFNRDAIAILLNQTDSAGNFAAGVRIYNGVDRNGQVRVVLVPYDNNGNDIIHQLVGTKSVAIPGIAPANAQPMLGQAVENGQRCPPICSGTVGLNVAK
jgi:hypothetical protein